MDSLRYYVAAGDSIYECQAGGDTRKGALEYLTIGSRLRDSRDGNRLTAMLENALRSALRRNAPATSHKLQAFIRELNDGVRTGRLPWTAAATLRNGAMSAIAELLSELTKMRDDRL